MSDVSVLPRDIDFGSDLVGRVYVRQEMRAARGGSSWAWEWTFNDLSRHLKAFLEDRALPVFEGPLLREAAWRNALALTNRTTLSVEPISVGDLEHRIKRLEGADVLVYHGKRLPVWLLKAELECELDRIRELGQTELLPPWPCADRLFEDAGGWVWDRFSDEQVLARTRTVYSAALVAYQDLVHTWFPRFAPQLRHINRMPMQIKGVIRVSTTDIGRHPWMASYIQKLPRTSENSVDITLAPERDQDFFPTGVDVARRQSLGEVFVLRPVTSLAYAWLAGDLNSLGWLDGSLRVPIAE